MTWHEVSLKQICAVDWGNTKLTKSSYVANGKFLAVSAAGADGLIDYFEHEANVPVLSAIGAQCGRMFYPGERFTAIKNTITLTPKETMVDGKFLYYLFTHVELPQRGAGQPFISKGDIEAFKVSIPESLEEQCEIVEKLDSAFAEIELLEKNLELSDEKTDQLLQSLLSSAFSSTVDENNSGNTLEDQSIARKLVSLGEVCTVINGGTPDTKISKFWNGKHAWITPAEMGNLKSPFLSRSKRTLTDEGLSNSSAQLVPKHSVIMSSRAPIGHLVINEVPMASNQGCKSLIPNKNLNYKYLYYFLYANKQYLNELGSGTTFAEISGSKLKTVLIPLPSPEKQNKVVEKLDSAFTEIALMKSQIKVEKDYAVALRQSLLSSAFTQDEAVA
ncbi:HsdS Restriction endonuclease S subunits [Candidatus Nanopelagicaceae bacterium]